MNILVTEKPKQKYKMMSVHQGQPCKTIYEKAEETMYGKKKIWLKISILV